MLGKLYAIILNTFLETIRQPIFGVLMWTAAGLLVLNPGISAFSLEAGGDSKIMKDVGLSTLLLYGLFAAVFSATGVITREIESFTVLTVVSKPVSRPLFLTGKYLGVVAALAVGFIFLTLVLLMTVQQGVMETVTDKLNRPVVWLSITAVLVSLVAATFGNYNYGWHFSTTLTAWVVPLGALAWGLTLTLDREWKTQAITTDLAAVPPVLYAAILIFVAVLILAAFAVTFSTRLGQVMTLTVCTGVFLVGLLADYYFWLHVNEGLPYVLAAAVLPNFQFFWLGDAITQERSISPAHVARVAGHGLLYATAVLCVGIALFQTREVG